MAAVMRHTWQCPDDVCPGLPAFTVYSASSPEALEVWIEFHEEAWHGIEAAS